MSFHCVVDDVSVNGEYLAEVTFGDEGNTATRRLRVEQPNDLDEFLSTVEATYGADASGAVKAAFDQQLEKRRAEGHAPCADPLDILKAGEMCEKFPELRPVIIEGILRRTESMGLVAAAKAGKTYLALGLALCIATGLPWLGTYPVTRGKVLYIDAELHPQTFARRLAAVAAGMGIRPEEFADQLHVVSLRGRLRDLFALGNLFAGITKGEYAVVFVDALYRVYPADFDENSNADMTRLWNQIDRYGDMLDAAFVVVHHASKGNQSGKSVVDVGSGASAQARAADSHVILRPHETDDAAVMEAAVRSFKPVPPMAIRWAYPVWSPAPDLDPSELRQPGTRKRRDTVPTDPQAPKPEPWTAERFAATFIADRAVDKQTILARGFTAGVPIRQGEMFIRLGLDAGAIHRWNLPKTNAVFLANIEQPVTATGVSK